MGQGKLRGKETNAADQKGMGCGQFWALAPADDALKSGS